MTKYNVIGWLTLSLALTGCAKDIPKIPYCEWSNTSKVFRCHDPVKDKKFQRTKEQLLSPTPWTCFDSQSILNFYDACNNFLPQPARTQCLVKERGTPRQIYFACFDDRAEEGFNILPEAAKGYACSRFEDFILVFNACEKKREDHLKKKGK